MSQMSFLIIILQTAFLSALVVYRLASNKTQSGTYAHFVKRIYFNKRDRISLALEESPLMYAH